MPDQDHSQLATRSPAVERRVEHREVVVPPSVDQVVLAQRRSGSDYARSRVPYVIDRLTRRAWLVESGLYQSTVLVGATGVLVIDPLARGREVHLQQAVRELTPLPITTLVYSHSHFDHIGGATQLLVDAHLAGAELRIVGNVNTLTELRRFGYQVPLPSEVVAVPRGGFLFEDEPIELVTPQFGHTRDNSIVLIPRERLAHNVDVIHPGRLPSERFGHPEDLRGLEMALRELLAQRWDLLNAGHGDVGVHADVLFVLEYLGDLRRVTLEVLGQLPADAFVHDAMSYNWSKAHRDAVTDRVVRRLRRSYGRLPGFHQVAHTHAEQMFSECQLHHRYEPVRDEEAGAR
jgi:glyoxylase-like metal-dependent hydrolase (beta-lactamase superfamily II)